MGLLPVPFDVAFRCEELACVQRQQSPTAGTVLPPSQKDQKKKNSPTRARNPLCGAMEINGSVELRSINQSRGDAVITTRPPHFRRADY